MDQKEESKPAAAQDDNIFVNTGLHQWEHGRRQWLNYEGLASQNKLCDDQQRCLPSSRKKKKGAVDLDVDNIIELILSNRWRLAAKGGQAAKEKATFNKPVPLPQMIDILVDLWEAEGMGDA